MLLLRDKEAWKKGWAFRDHGKDYQIMQNTENHQGFPWPHTSIGTNWRMTEIQAAIGRLQLAKLPKWLKQRRDNAFYLLEKLAELDCLTIPEFPDYIFHSFYRVYIQLNIEKLKHTWDKNKIIHEINKVGVPCYEGSCNEIYKESAFRIKDKPLELLPNAKKLGQTSICLLCHPTLELSDINSMSETIINVLKNASK